MVKLHSATLSDPFSISLTSLSSACILLLAMPFFLTILAKHQAFAPLSAISLHSKLNFVKVEFALRPSAKAFESSSWIDQTLGPPSPPFLLGICQAVEPWVSVWKMVSFVFSHLSHQVWLNLIKNSPQENRHPNTTQPIWPPQNNQWRIRITTHLHMSLKYARSIDLRAHIQNFLSHWAAALI